MKKIFTQTLSPSFAISILALAVALGGGAAYATSRAAAPQATSVRCFNISHFLHGWKNFSRGFHKVEVCKDSLGYVHLDGVITGGTPGTAAFVMPRGDRPRFNHAFAVAAGLGGPVLVDVDVFSGSSANGPFRNDVFVNGSVNDAVSLDGVTFHVG